MMQAHAHKLSWFLSLMAIGAVALLLSGRLLPAVQAAPEAADSGTKPLPPSVVAVIDVAKIFTSSKAQATRIASLKADIDAFDAAVKATAAEIKEAGEKQKLLPAGSDEAAQAELQVKQLALAAQTKIGQKKAEFLKREGEIYFDTYAEMEKVLKIEARKRGVTMVLRLGNESMNRNERESVLKGVNKPIVFLQEQYDLTEVVIQAMNEG